jgi:response regulator of citrate/malate metabolism
MSKEKKALALLLEKAVRDNNGCLNCHLYGPYPKITVDCVVMLAHRFVHSMLRKRVEVGQVVMHSCDNPQCINIDHLVLGTQSDNIKDCVSKGRNVGRRLGPEAVARIKELRKQGLGVVAIAAKTAVSRVTVRKYAKGASDV